MVNLHCEILTHKSGLLKLGTVIVGAVDIGLIADSYDPIFTEKPLLIVIGIFLSISFLYLLSLIIGSLNGEGWQKKFEIFYHVVAALLIFMTASVFLFSVFGRSCEGNCSSLMTKRYLSAVFGFLDGILYALVAWYLLDIRIVSTT